MPLEFNTDFGEVKASSTELPLARLQKDRLEKSATYFDIYDYRLTCEARAGFEDVSYERIISALKSADIRYREDRRYNVRPDRVVMEVLIQKEDIASIKKLNSEMKSEGLTFTFNGNLPEDIQDRIITTPENAVEEKEPDKTASKNKVGNKEFRDFVDSASIDLRISGDTIAVYMRWEDNSDIQLFIEDGEITEVSDATLGGIAEDFRKRVGDQKITKQDVSYILEWAKPEPVRKVLQLMDGDFEYSEAINISLQEYPDTDKKELEGLVSIYAGKKHFESGKKQGVKNKEESATKKRNTLVKKSGKKQGVKNKEESAMKKRNTLVKKSGADLIAVYDELDVVDSELEYIKENPEEAEEIRSSVIDMLKK